MKKQSRLSSLLEKDVVNLIRLALQRIRVTTWRNQVGAYQIPGTDRWIYYGLFKGSSDYIALLEHTVRPEDVGRKFAIFGSIETKRPRGGRLSEDQRTWIEAIKKKGGFAGVATTPEEAEEIINKFLAGETT